MIFGILPFLIQWIALSQIGKLSNYQYSRSFNTILPSYSESNFAGNEAHSGDFVHHSLPPKSHWTLLADFQRLNEDEMEIFLPQLCNMMLDDSSSSSLLSDARILDYFQQILCQKCSECLPFGIRVTNMLRALLAAEQGGQYSLFRQMLLSSHSSSASSPSSQSDGNSRESRIRRLLEKIEQVTAQGNPNLPVMVSDLRAEYYRDFQFMLDTLARLGVELKSYPIHQRNFHLRRALSQCNALFYYRMLTQKSITELSNEDILSFYNHYSNLQVESIAQYCPAAACFSLHLPLQRSSEKCLRILRFIENESELLPSKDRCPYLVVVELLEQPFSCKSDELYTEGRRLCLQTVEDVLNHRGMNYQNPQMMPTLSEYDHHYYQHQNLSPHKSLQYQTSSATFSSRSLRSRRRNFFHHNPRLLQNQKTRGETNRSEQVKCSTDQSKAIRQDNRFEAPKEGNDDNDSSETKTQEDLLYWLITNNDRRLSFKKRILLQRQFLRQREEMSAGDEIESSVNIDELLTDQEQQEYLAKLSKAEEVWNGHNLMSHRNQRNIQLFARHERQSLPKPSLSPSSDAIKTSSAPASSNNTENGESLLDIRGGKSAELSFVKEEDQYIGRDYHGGSSSSFPSSSNHHENYPPHSPSTMTPPYFPSHHSYHHSDGPNHPHISSPGHANTFYHAPENRLPQHTMVRTKTWEEKKAIIKSLSPFGHLEGWNLASFIVKSGDDLRKEVLAMQLIEYFQKIFQYEHVDIFVKPYQILVAGPKSGLIEFLEGTISVDRIKKLYLRSGASSGNGPNPVDPNIPPTTTSASSSGFSGSGKVMSLSEYFALHFGESYSPLFHKAVNNFVRSLAGYSLITYLLQVKDRHNANILIDSEGHIIHIDFGFILGESPGFNINFESAPFKFTQEYLDLIGGNVDSPLFRLFEDLFIRGFLAIQKHVDGIASIIQLYYDEKKGKEIVDLLKSRLLFAKTTLDIQKLIHESMDNFRTKSYDWYQQKTNNIFM